jgi:ABC-type nitrate/sulfonate/bicarbonate transport system permease component
VNAMFRWLRARSIRLTTIVLLVVAWEMAARLSPTTPLAQTPLVPPLSMIFGSSLLGMADYWKFPFWAPMTSLGGAQTYRGALLAVGYHSALTLMRLAAGLAIGAFCGVGLGLLISCSPILRRAAYLPLALVRMLPLLAMIPLFQFWVGANTAGVIAIVAVSTGAVFLVGAVNAVANVPGSYVDYALTLGANRAQVYAWVIWPGILPELFSSVMLTLGLAWSAVVAGEYVGIDSGLGRILTFAQFMSQTGRMALVALLLVFYASVSFFAFRRLSRRLLAWMPNKDN